ncbi:MAG: hypothetical protein KJ667_04730, partial [Alphaproteobacteria bacterium]|nr:hypothetical protein [Alphaproteobacteria bacterium]
MIKFIKYRIFLRLLGMSAFFMLAAGSSAAIAQNIPGSADAGRIEVLPEEILPPREVLPIIMPDIAAPEVPLPEGVEEITFVLKSVIIEGMNAFTPE